MYYISYPAARRDRHLNQARNTTSRSHALGLSRRRRPALVSEQSALTVVVSGTSAPEFATRKVMPRAEEELEKRRTSLWAPAEILRDLSSRIRYPDQVRYHGVIEEFRHRIRDRLPAIVQPAGHLVRTLRPAQKACALLNHRIERRHHLRQR